MFEELQEDMNKKLLLEYVKIACAVIAAKVYARMNAGNTNIEAEIERYKERLGDANNLDEVDDYFRNCLRDVQIRNGRENDLQIEEKNGELIVLVRRGIFYLAEDTPRDRDLLTEVQQAINRKVQTIPEENIPEM